MDKSAAVAPAEPPPLGSPPLRREGPLPLHRQIAAALRRQFAAGELRPGDLLPSENELVARFGVSRGTVRQALVALRQEGTIAGSRGRPSVVRQAPLTQPFSELLSFSAWIRSLGLLPGGLVVEFGQRSADAAAAEALGLCRGGPIYRLVRVRLVEHQPLMIERTSFPPRVGRLVADLDLDHDSIYAELAARGLVIASARHLIDALPASAADARLLGVSARTALLRDRRRSFGAAGEPLEWSDDRYLGDRIAFSVANSAAASNVVRRLERVGG